MRRLLSYKTVITVCITMILATVYSVASLSSPLLTDLSYLDFSKETRKQIDCLADNIYYEAGFEPDTGKVAVALVTLNRTQDSRFPRDICGVVKQKTQGICQFSWFCSPKLPGRSREVYAEAREVAVHVYANYENIKDITKGALYYHADYVNPRWHNLSKTTKIGRHIFYKESEKRDDAKAKPTIERGHFLKAFVLPNDGRSFA